MYAGSRGAKARRKYRRRRGRAARPLIALVALMLAAAGVLLYLRAREADLIRRYPMEYVSEIRGSAEEFSLEPALVASVILAESSYRPDAVSKADARGLMQILPSTGEWIAHKLDEPFDMQNLFEPEVNIRYGCWYLKFLMDRYGGNMRNAIAAYHAGQGTVDQWLQNPEYSPDGEALEVTSSDATNTYVNRVLSNYAHYSTVY
ncbi:MAG: lytic transglycosylase domain-containing protein [Clostridiales bacterium]|jgi:soluble lytic murein transglycosylase|nr:lytic transglycosylase domain-containing protein [Clostridiales bacterium]